MMNPHFIFNILNTIQYFIVQDHSKEANNMLSVFAKFIRKHFEISLKKTITLKEEIEYLGLYLELEKIRSNKKINYKIVVQENIDPEEILLPLMLIQPFVDNVIWHSIIPKEGNGMVKIDFQLHNKELKVEIVDDGTEITNSPKSETNCHVNTSLDLFQERVKLLNKLTGKKIEIEKNKTDKLGTKILITIPI
jgi:LytS/YehU family sensor histidine kinase